ncbi:MAG: peptidoglycan DD-metalloendopeptidase family protein [Lachnospiraceae bacterium]|nr:peptidoglycan DD-metalloendopeptidase family protein [Lachnospiraceae bacterium]
MVKKKALSIVCILLSAVFVIGLAEPLKATSIQDEKDKQEELQNKIDDVETIIEELEKLKDDTNAYIKEMDNKLEEITGYIVDLESQIETKNAEIEEIQLTLEKQEADIQSQYEAMKKRIRFMYENGQQEYLDLILSSGSIGDFLNKAEYLTKITEYDRNMLDKMKETKELIEQTKETLENEKSELQVLKDTADEEKKQIEVLVEEKGKLLEETEQKIQNEEANIETMQGEIAASQAIVAELEEIERKRKEEEERRKKEEQEQQQNANKDNQNNQNSTGTNKPAYSGGKLLWPVPGYYTISSDYGYRVSPISGKDEFHSGLDIPAPRGTEIIAAAGGTVAWAYKSSSAGNWVGIDHGNGVSTVYMHMSRFAVSEGERVSAGQVIGYVGSTGWSTGNHLHFSVRLNGSYVNPHNYLGK